LRRKYAIEKNRQYVFYPRHRSQKENSTTFFRQRNHERQNGRVSHVGFPGASRSSREAIFPSRLITTINPIHSSTGSSYAGRTTAGDDAYATKQVPA
jgi:hypothetical protein